MSSSLVIFGKISLRRGVHRPEPVVPGYAQPSDSNPAKILIFRFAAPQLISCAESLYRA
jgi:hypothetical protein